MKVVVHLTLDGMKESILEGDSTFLSGAPGDELEQKGLGFWLSEWRCAELHSHSRKGRVFIPWPSALYVEEVVNGGKKIENKAV